MKAEAEIFPIDTKDLNTANKVKVILTTENDNQKKVFIGYLDVSGKINKIE